MKRDGYCMISFCYGIILLMSFILVVILFNIRGKKSAFFELVFFMILIGNVGFFAIGLSSTVEEAILANKLTYIAGCFLPCFLLLSICELCKMPVQRKYMNIMICCNFAVMLLSGTAGWLPIFYKEVYLEKFWGASYLVKEYGPLHCVYGIFLACYVFLMVYVIIKAYSNKNEISHKTVNFMAILVFLNVAVYISEKIISVPVELLPFVYCLDEVILISAIRRVSMYDMTNNIILAEQKAEEYGYVTLDMEKKYLGSNQFAKDFFPELNQCRVDYAITDKDNTFYKEVVRKIYLFEESGKWEDFYVQMGPHSIKCSIRYLYSNKKSRRVGYMIVMEDVTRQQSFIQLLNKYNDDLESMVEEKTRHIRQIQDKIIVSMADVVESRDDNTGGHVKRTSECVRIFVEKLKEFPEEFPYSDKFLIDVVKAAPMHDLGKITVDDFILRKPGRYTPEEYEVMKRHSSEGAKIVQMVLENVEDSSLLQTAVNIAHYHHEKWDGSGYPEKLKGEEIPVEARIMALADVFDALVSKRCYKEAYDYKKAFQIIEESLGSHFDEKLGRVFLLCKDELMEYYDKQFEEEKIISVS